MKLNIAFINNVPLEKVQPKTHFLCEVNRRYSQKTHFLCEVNRRYSQKYTFYAK